MPSSLCVASSRAAAIASDRVGTFSMILSARSHRRTISGSASLALIGGSQQGDGGHAALGQFFGGRFADLEDLVAAAA